MAEGIFVNNWYCSLCMVDGTEDGGLGTAGGGRPSIHLLQIHRIYVSTLRTVKWIQSRHLQKKPCRHL